MKVCSVCREQKELDNFSPTKRNEDGSIKYRASQCTRCRTNKNRKTPEYKQDEVTKECRHCRLPKPHEEFSPSIRGKLGLSAYCRPCEAVRFKPDKEAARKATADYRARYPERVRASHRLHQLKRRSRITATSDGTVTDEFLKDIYSRVECFWCRKDTEESERTLEHVIELTSGGSHSASNIEMACRSCNSARLGRDRNGNQC